MMDLMRTFAPGPRWCHARVCQDGRDATPADVRPGEEEVGQVAGDDVMAQYGFDGGVTGSYESARADDGGEGNYFRLELCGTGGIITIWSGSAMPVYLFPRPYALPDRRDEWQALTPEAQPLPDGAPESAGAMHPANQLIVRDLLGAVEEGRQPLSSGPDARAALEMILAVYASHIAGGRVDLPLRQREHPLSAWTA
jgi:predicted dehydrogenase